MSFVGGGYIDSKKLYIGGEYDCKVTAGTGYNPSCIVESSDPDSIEVYDVETDINKIKEQDEVYFKFKVLKIPTEDVTITATSTVSAYNSKGTKTCKVTIPTSNVLKPLEKDLVANTYVCDKNTIELKPEGYNF